MIFEFNDCELDLDRVVLRRGGTEVAVEPQVFDVLELLIERRGQVVRKEELLDEIWGDRFVSESALTSRMKSARRAVGDDGSRQAVIRTVHGKGYEFIAEVLVCDEPATGAPTPDTTPRAGGPQRTADVAATAHRSRRAARPAGRRPRRESGASPWSAAPASARRPSASSWHGRRR